MVTLLVLLSLVPVSVFLNLKYHLVNFIIQMGSVPHVFQVYLTIQSIKNVQHQQLKWFQAVNQQFIWMEITFVQLVCKVLLWMLQMEQSATKLLCIVPFIQVPNLQFVQFAFLDTFCSITHVQNSQLNALLLTQKDFVFNVLQVTQFQMVHAFRF